jgi:hypothetical protein
MLTARLPVHSARAGRSIAQAYEEMVPETKAEPEEVEMARKLIEASAAKKFDLAAYP